MPKVDNTKENMKKCICGQCPSYNQCMEEKKEGMYCSRGKSSCDFEKKGCVCGACPLTSEYGLDKLYYCEIGKAE